MNTWFAERPPYRITTDPARIDLDVVHDFLYGSYWARGIPREVVARSIAGSLPLGLFAHDAQVGFARVITDRATFGYLADVFVLEAHRGRGLARWMVQTALSHPDLLGIRRWLLVTRDAHRLYAQEGFRVPLEGTLMERCVENPYGAAREP